MLTIQVSPIYPLTIHISEKTNETKEEDRNSWHCGVVGGWGVGVVVGDDRQGTGEYRRHDRMDKDR